MNSNDSKDCSIELEGAEAKALDGKAGSKTRHRKPDSNYFRKEVIDGDDWNDDRGKFVDRHRSINKDGDRYIEKVVDPDTGEVLHDIDEPLSDHHGHGSDKPRRPRD